ncbi:MAG TPA: TonB-dependent receptor [Blastocatellia bacterium]|nr:TonB-dependent receptor [Blastocatellia bacterium]
MTLFILTGLMWSGAIAQTTTSTVSGTVKDSTGAVVPDTKVVLRDTATRREITVVTNHEGQFVFANVTAGNYEITAEKASFRKADLRDITVNVGVPATVNIELQPGTIAEIVTTTATDSQAVVNTENAELQTTVLSRQINDLPLNGRNPLDLANLQAGVNQSGDNREASVNGLRGTFTNLTWDGININDNFIRTDTFFGVAAPSVVSVSEFTLTTQNGGPTDGLGVAQVKLITPRGSTQFHGSLFEFHRNDALDANSFFNNATGVPKEKLIRNQYGFNLGGPIKLPKKVFGPVGFDTDKLFFFTYYEGTKERTQASVLRTVLTQPARQGSFTYRRADNGQLQTVNLLALAGARGVVDPIAKRLIDLTPLPNDLASGDLANTPGAAASSNVAGYRFNTGSGTDQNLWGFRVDYDATAKHRFEATFSRFDFNLPNDPFNAIEEPFPGLPGGGQKSTRPRGSFAWNWTPTTNLNNELRGGFNNYDVRFFTREPFADGFRVTFPLITDPVQNTLPQGRKATNYEIFDNVNWVKGRHQVRFGGSYRRVYTEPFDFVGTIPLYTIGFNGVGLSSPLRRNATSFPGGISTDDFSRATNILEILTAPVSQADQTFNVASRTSGFTSGAESRQRLSYHTISGYAGDTWRARSNFTFNAGVRYEYISVPTEQRGLALLPRGGLGALRDPNAVLDFAGSGTGRAFFNDDLNNFAPSVSFSWDPFGHGKMAIRAGYSISYVIDNNITTVLNAITAGDGLATAVTIDDVAGTLSGRGRVTIPAPQFKVPRTISENLAINSQTALFTIDPKLRTPYVQQWNLSIERQILPDTIFEVRYVGNRGTKLTRGVDINQLRIFDNGFLADFQRAQRNLAAHGDPTVGETLQIFPKLGDFSDFGLGIALLDDPGVRSLIAQGQVGELARFYVVNRDFFLDPNNGFGVQLTPGFFLPANPNTFVADYIGNGSYSTYHGLQAEIRRRLSHGFYFQANYTYSKAFTDSEGGQTNFAGLLDLNKGLAVEKQRISNDITHVFKANGVYELPFGPGKRFLGAGGVSGKVFGGWSLNGIWRWQSGEPVSIVSQRGTVNRAARSTKNTVDTTLPVSDLQNKTGLFKDAQGRPILFDPSLIGSDGRANSQFFKNPEAGRLGTLHLTPVSGPNFFNVDLSLIKRTAITESVNVEFRADAFNVFNNVNFNIDQVQNINSTSFGRITSTFDPRIFQFALKLNF